MADALTINVTGVAEKMAALAQFPDALERNMPQAWEEMGVEIIESEGLQAYPGEYHAAQFPYGFVSDKQRRYFFAALKSGEIEVPYRRGQSPGSERYGTQFYTEQRGAYGAVIGNRAAYAEYLAGGGSGYMAAGGWKKLIDVAREKLGRLEAILAGWIEKTAKDVGL